MSSLDKFIVFHQPANRFIITILLLFALAGVTSCKKVESGQEVSGKEQTANEGLSGAAASGDEYRKGIEARLEGLDKQIKELEKNARKTTGESKKKVERNVSKLNEMMENARQDLKDLWRDEARQDEIRKRLDETLDSIDKTVSDAASSIMG